MSHISPIPAPMRERELCECGRPVAPHWADWCGHCERDSIPAVNPDHPLAEATGEAVHFSSAIPITQALPPLAERVLAWTGDRWTIASRHSRWIAITGHIINPSHWQHLPAAPQ